ncbi:MAG: hydroxymethylglutaryl-CoA lyase [Armatimonadetes bacterium]|nr:hydroxymethylglutaryl-CoA lyase [Armatimonadota bacterium]
MIRIIEVGPRDGLQNEKVPVPTSAKLDFIQGLLASGLKEIEVSSFVSPKWVPQLGDVEELWPALPVGGIYSALVPNKKGLERAVALGVGRIALFTASSDAFTQKNINMTVAESLEVFRDILAEYGGWVRGYVSTAFECPYAGRIAPSQTVLVAQTLIDMGVAEVSIGDTIGVASPAEVRVLTQMLLSEIPAEKICYHFHDTRGTAIANVSEALEMGIRAFDSSAAGLGGCPYAPGAGGNLATEDLVYFLEREGVSTGVDPVLLAQASVPILKLLQKPVTAKAQLATLAQKPS